jgi:hypothetical protein
MFFDMVEKLSITAPSISPHGGGNGNWNFEKFLVYVLISLI